MVYFKQKGDFSKLNAFFEKSIGSLQFGNLDKYGQAGVEALSAATPVDSGKTAGSWYYRIERIASGVSLVFLNSNVNNNVPIAIILQFGHGTGTGGWVEGRDYINPAIQPIFDELAETAWREVSGK